MSYEAEMKDKNDFFMVNKRRCSFYIDDARSFAAAAAADGVKK